MLFLVCRLREHKMTKKLLQILKPFNRLAFSQSQQTASTKNWNTAQKWFRLQTMFESYLDSQSSAANNSNTHWFRSTSPLKRKYYTIMKLGHDKTLPGQMFSLMSAPCNCGPRQWTRVRPQWAEEHAPKTHFLCRESVAKRKTCRSKQHAQIRVGLRRIPGSSVLSRTIEVKGKTAGIRKANEGATAEASRALIVITCTQAPACELSQASQMQV